ncbi:repressor [Achromatium sp. WMS1]|nr:repressor [Achromatium sp. WMS1]
MEILSNSNQIDSHDCSFSSPFALQVLGNDMEPEFPDRCIIVIDPSDQCGDGAYVFVEIEGVRWFRQYRETSATGRKWLAAVNTLYPDIELNGHEYNILGVIIQRNIRRKIKHYSHFPNKQLNTK